MTYFWCSQHEQAHAKGEDVADCLLVGPFPTKTDAEQWASSSESEQQPNVAQSTTPASAPSAKAIRERIDALSIECQMAGWTREGANLQNRIEGMREALTFVEAAASLPEAPSASPPVNVLDHGFVRLVEHMGSDLSVARNARVSYNAEWRAGKDEGSDERLINYLIRHGHTSPFESVTFTFDVKAPIFVFRQWHRHRTWSYNEVSARYSELPADFYVPDIANITTQSKDNKQMRTKEMHPEAAMLQKLIRHQCWEAYQTYQSLLKGGCPRELARGVLPLNVYSHMFATVDLHNLFHFLRLRLHAHAQYEIRVYAEAILQLIQPLVPVSVVAWKRHILKEIP